MQINRPKKKRGNESIFFSVTPVQTGVHCLDMLSAVDSGLRRNDKKANLNDKKAYRNETVRLLCAYLFFALIFSSVSSPAQALPQFTLPQAQSQLNEVYFHPNGSELLELDTVKHHVRVWDWKKHRLKKTLTLAQDSPDQTVYGERNFLISANQNILMIASNHGNGLFRFYDARTYQLLSVIDHIADQPTRYQPFAISPDGNYLSIMDRRSVWDSSVGQHGSYLDCHLKVWHIRSGKLIQIIPFTRIIDDLPGHPAHISLAYHPSKPYLSIASESGVLKVWDIVQGRWVSRQSSDFGILQYSRSGQYLAWLKGRNLNLWDLDWQRRRQYALSQHDILPTQLEFSSNQHYIALVAYKDTGHLFSLNPPGHWALANARQLLFSPDSRFLAYSTVTDNAFVSYQTHLMALPSGRRVWSLTTDGLNDGSLDIKFSPDGRFYAYLDSCSYQDKCKQAHLILRSSYSHHTLLTIPYQAHTSEQYLLPRFEFSPDSRYLLSQLPTQAGLQFWSLDAAKN